LRRTATRYDKLMDGLCEVVEQRACSEVGRAKALRLLALVKTKEGLGGRWCGGARSTAGRGCCGGWPSRASTCWQQICWWASRSARRRRCAQRSTATSRRCASSWSTREVNGYTCVLLTASEMNQQAEGVLVTISTAGAVSALPAFSTGRTGEELRALAARVRALADQISAAAEAERLQGAQRHNALLPFLAKVSSIDPIRQALFDHLTYVEITRLAEVSLDTKGWSCKAQTEVGLCDEKGVPVSEVRAGAMPIDVAAGQHVPVMRRQGSTCR